jgi:hypothetical protein
MSQLALLLQGFLFTARIWRSIAAINHGAISAPPRPAVGTCARFTFTLFAWQMPRRASQFPPLNNDSAGMPACFYADCTTFTDGFNSFLLLQHTWVRER